MPVLPTYGRADVTFVEGEGAWLTASDGRRFLDFAAGIAVVGLGHCHPAPVAAAQAQLERLWHVSNLYWTEPMAALARLLSERFGGAEAFFCNSGAEAIEAAIKYARKATGKPGIVALEGSFHGRTFGALSVTGQPAKRRAFEPLVPGVTFAQLNDIASLEAVVGSDTGLILLEPVQGEGGVNPASPDFLAAAAKLAAENGALLCFDEVQTGVGRTGTFFAFEQLGVRPHLVTLAKGLANGLPIGALLAADDAPRGFVPGDHASTFGGNPVVCAAACAVVEAVDEELLANVRERERAAGGRPACAWRRPAARARPRPLRGIGRRGVPRRGIARYFCRRQDPASLAPAGRDRRRGRAGDLHSPGGSCMTAHRRERQGAILRLIRERQISTQSELADALREAGHEVVQTTVSRDISELGLVKVRAANGRLAYAHAGAADLDRLRELESAFRRWAMSIESNDQLVVVFTPRGFAAALAEAIDESHHPHVLATVAGDNTILVVPAAGVSAASLREELSRHLLEGAA